MMLYQQESKINELTMAMDSLKSEVKRLKTEVRNKSYIDEIRKEQIELRKEVKVFQASLNDVTATVNSLKSAHESSKFAQGRTLSRKCSDIASKALDAMNYRIDLLQSEIHRIKGHKRHEEIGKTEHFSEACRTDRANLKEDVKRMQVRLTQLTEDSEIIQDFAKRLNEQSQKLAKIEKATETKSPKSIRKDSTNVINESDRFDEKMKNALEKMFEERCASYLDKNIEDIVRKYFKDHMKQLSHQCMEKHVNETAKMSSSKSECTSARHHDSTDGPVISPKFKDKIKKEVEKLKNTLQSELREIEHKIEKNREKIEEVDNKVKYRGMTPTALVYALPNGHGESRKESIKTENKTNEKEKCGLDHDELKRNIQNINASTSQHSNEIVIIDNMFKDVYECISVLRNGILETKADCGKLYRQLEWMLSLSGKEKNLKKFKPPCFENHQLNGPLNCSLQMFLSCEKFVQDVMQCYHSLNGDKRLIKFRTFHDLLQILLNENVRERKLSEVSKSETFRDWNKSGQYNTYELMNNMLYEVFKETRNSSDKKDVFQKGAIPTWTKTEMPMKIKLYNQTMCECQLITTSHIHTDFALHITVPNDETGGVSVQDLVKGYFSPEIIKSYSCENKDCKSQTAKKVVIIEKPLPRTLCIHLQKPQPDGSRTKKVRKPISFTMKLIIPSAFCGHENGVLRTDSSCQRTKSPSDSKCLPIKSTYERIESLRKTLRQNLSVNEEFGLKSVIASTRVGSGTHYICYTYYDKSWYLIDDNKIYSVAEDIVFKSDPFVFLFEKRDEFCNIFPR